MTATIASFSCGGLILTVEGEPKFVVVGQGRQCQRRTVTGIARFGRYFRTCAGIHLRYDFGD
jgi:hypothetical protein